MSSTQKKVEELFAAQAHLGHKRNRIHPKSKKYIYTVENGVSIIDLTKTVKLLEEAKKFLTSLSKEQKKLLIVATKKVSAAQVEKYAKEHNIAYITLKWPAGLLTNFEHVFKNVKKMVSMEEEKKNGEWNSLVKHEQSMMGKELAKLKRNYGGLAILTTPPDALFIIDVKKEKNAVAEAKRMNIPVVALLDTNVNPDSVDYPIPANDDSLTSIEYIMRDLLESYTKKGDN